MYGALTDAPARGSSCEFIPIESLLRKAPTLLKRLPQPEEVQEATTSYDPASSRYHVERYLSSRYFVLYDGEQLLAVTVYRKGAEAVRDRLQVQEAKLAQLTHNRRGESPASLEQPGAIDQLQAERGPEQPR